MKLATMIGAVASICAGLSAFFFYLTVNQHLGETYAQKVQALSFYKFEIIRQSLLIFVGFGFIAFAGVIFFGILYTHRIAGPLFRIRMIARELAAGNFSQIAKFRKNDAIHSLAESVNHFSREQAKRRETLLNGIDELDEGTGVLKELIRKGDADGAMAARIKVAEKTEELNKMLSGIRV